MSNSPVHSILQQTSNVGPSQTGLEHPLLSDFKLFKPSTRPVTSPGERKFTLPFWHLSHIVPAHLPDEYFVPTPTDLKAAQATLSARTQALINAPLQLRAARETELKAKRDRWPEVLYIRLMYKIG
jgi:tether containing UBX domain for GLUT4